MGKYGDYIEKITGRKNNQTIVMVSMAWTGVPHSGVQKKTDVSL